MSVALALAACGPPPRAADTAVIASGADLESANPIVTVHPLSRQLQRHALFVTLVRLDSALGPVPYFARTWTWSPTRDSLTFELSRKLRWHDGVTTSCADVAFTLAAVRDTALGSPRAGELANVEDFSCEDEFRLRIVFSAPQSALPTIFAELPIVPRHMLDTVPRASWRAASFSTNPVGNGPFRFLDRVAGRRWRFVRNPDFPAELGGPPKLAQLVVAVVDESATKFAGLVSGELDLAGVSPTMAALVARDSTLALMTPPALFTTLLAFNVEKAPFSDVRVRRAISLAIDRRRVVDAAVAGYAVPTASAIPPGLPFSRMSEPRVDRDEAARLLDSAGVRRGPDGRRLLGGRPFVLQLLTVGSGDLAVEQLVQADLAAIGITADIRVAELASFLAEVRAPRKTFDVVLTGVPGDLALGHLSALFSSAQAGGALDYTGFHRPSLDRALLDARQSAPASAVTAWARVDSILSATMPVAWLYHARGVQGRSRRLHGVTMDLRGELVSVANWTRATSERHP